jgi:hypothetical protein
VLVDDQVQLAHILLHQREYVLLEAGELAAGHA